MKRYTYIFFRISMVLFILNFALPSVKAADCIPDWKYYTPVTVQNNVFSALANYQIKITVNTAALISGGKMISSGDDIRFTDNSTCTLLPYWIESGMNTANTVIWVKLAALAATSTQTVKMYYGNTAAPAVSNGDSTFAIFDDFSGTALSSKWKEVGSTSNYTISNGQISISAGSGSNIGSKLFVSNASFTSPLIVEGLVTSTAGYYSGLGLLNSGTSSGYSLNYGGASAGANAGMHIGQNYSNSGSIAYNVEATNTGPGNLTGIWSLAWPSSTVQTGSWPGGALNATSGGLILNSTVQVEFGMPYTSNGFTSFDWVRARSYALSEPTVTLGAEHYNHNSGIPGSAQKDGFSIYPNPAHEKLNISFSTANHDFETVTLIDMTGKAVKSLNIPFGENTVALPVADMIKGVYFVRITRKDASLVKQIVVE